VGTSYGNQDTVRTLPLKPKFVWSSSGSDTLLGIGDTLNVCKGSIHTFYLPVDLMGFNDYTWVINRANSLGTRDDSINVNNRGVWAILKFDSPGTSSIKLTRTDTNSRSNSNTITIVVSGSVPEFTCSYVTNNVDFFRLVVPWDGPSHPPSRRFTWGYDTLPTLKETILVRESTGSSYRLADSIDTNKKYWVIVSDESGTDTCRTKIYRNNHIPVGVDPMAGDWKNAGMIRVFPNPTSGIVRVESELPWDYIRVTDGLGRIVWEERTTMPNLRAIDIPMDNNLPGLYYVSVFARGGSAHAKIIRK
jgi:hypothetical protein